ncbi:AbiH family protein [Enterococcus hirae]|uniref:AbiH family protein n=1 Tax=Enterococcus hirae TaxID=1354 RepID=UPI003101B1CC
MSEYWFHTFLGIREYDSRFRKIGKGIIDSNYNKHNIYNLLKTSNLTFWDLVFYFSKDYKMIENYDWQDVERRMLEFLNTPEEKTKIPSLDKINFLIRGLDSKGNIATLLCLHLAYYLPEREKEYSKENLIDYLYDELVLFEKDFSEYINSISDESYQKEAKEKILKISGKSLADCKDKIFSFNYTDPFSKHGLDIVNVHGKAETNTILFGIDQEVVLPDSQGYRFTKTFRQMTETKLAKSYEDNILPDKADVEEIAFFGHSLSELDYSYFQTIFDYYNLYNSSVKLVFYYEKYGDKTEKDMELDLAEKISRMLYAYSPSIDNPKKGGNLQHKLLLEKRLIIEEIS